MEEAIDWCEEQKIKRQQRRKVERRKLLLMMLELKHLLSSNKHLFVLPLFIGFNT
jgi:hypothetical protein